MNPFAENFRRLRISRRLRQKELAHYLNLDASSVCQLELGRRGPLGREQLDKFIDLLELDKEEEDQLLIDARISSPMRKVRTDIGRDRLLLLDALMENLDVLTDDQVDLIARVIKMRVRQPTTNRQAIISRGGDAMSK